MNQNIYKVFSAKLARRLLSLGYQIVDVVPNRNNKERTVFVFKLNEGLLREVCTYKKQIMNDHSSIWSAS